MSDYGLPLFLDSEYNLLSEGEKKNIFPPLSDKIQDQTSFLCVYIYFKT